MSLWYRRTLFILIESEGELAAVLFRLHFIFNLVLKFYYYKKKEKTMIGIIFVFTYLIQATTSIEELSIDTFFDKLSSTDDLTSDNNVVYFYSPWYRSMAKMMPIVETAEAEINGFHYFIVDGTKEVLLAKAMDVSTYPSVYLFKGKDFQKAYFGKPRKKDLFAFLK